jgi:hypothetical protein
LGKFWRAFGLEKVGILFGTFYGHLVI